MKIAFNVTYALPDGTLLLAGGSLPETPFFEVVATIEQAIISAALKQNKGLAHAARTLGMNKNSLRTKVNKYGLDYRPGKGGKKGKRK